MPLKICDFAVFVACIGFSLVLAQAAVGQDPCLDAVEIGDVRRSTAYSSTIGLCDYYLPEAWYKFTQFNGDRMPTSCVPMGHCGTEYPVWMNGTHPTVYNSPEYHTACTRIGGDCCGWSMPIQVQRCPGDYYVYYLPPTLTCSSAYCFGHETNPCASDEIHDGIRCIGAHPVSNGSVILRPPVMVGNNAFEFRCDIPYPQHTDDDGARFRVEFTFDLSQDITKTANSTAPFAILKHTELAGRMGTMIRCHIKSYWSTRGSIMTSDVWTSNGYWIGIKTNPQSPLVLNEKNPEPVSLKFYSTVPILPDMLGRTQILINVKSGNNRVRSEFCNVNLTSESWNGHESYNTSEGHIPLVLAIDQGRNNLPGRIQFQEIPSLNKEFNDYIMDDVVINVIDNSANGKCWYDTDPHTKTFDKHYSGVMRHEHYSYDNMAIGDFILVRNKALNIEAQVRQRPCGGFGINGAACTCAVAIREHNTILGVDMCHYGQGYFGAPRLIRYLSEDTKRGYIKNDTHKQWTMVMASGINITVSVTNRYINTAVSAASRHQRQLDGLCGNFDGDYTNDVKNTNTIRAPQGRSFFSGHVACDRNIGSKIVNCVCTNPDKKKVHCDLSDNDNAVNTIVMNSNCDLKRHKRSTDLHIEDDDEVDGADIFSVIDEAPAPPPTNLTWPTANGYTHTQILEACTRMVQGNPAYPYCPQSANIDSMIDVCVFDGTMMDSLDVIASYLDLVQDTCRTIAETEVYIPADATEAEAAAAYDIVNAITRVSCPANCSGHGTCVSGMCQCINGYLGNDCSVSTSDVPEVVSVSRNEECDRSVRRCHQVRLVAKNLYQSSSLRCKTVPETISEAGVVRRDDLTEEVPAVLSSFAEVKCDVSGFRGLNVVGYILSVSTHGATYGNEIKSVVYDSQCLDISNNIIVKDNTCFIDGYCHFYGAAKADGTSQICMPNMAKFKWTVHESLYTPWAEWTSCPVSCTRHTRSRRRVCVNPACQADDNSHFIDRQMCPEYPHCSEEDEIGEQGESHNGLTFWTNAGDSDLFIRDLGRVCAIIEENLNAVCREENENCCSLLERRGAVFLDKCWVASGFPEVDGSVRMIKVLVQTRSGGSCPGQDRKRRETVIKYQYVDGCLLEEASTSVKETVSMELGIDVMKVEAECRSAQHGSLMPLFIGCGVAGFLLLILVTVTCVCVIKKCNKKPVSNSQAYIRQSTMDQIHVSIVSNGQPPKSALFLGDECGPKINI